MANPYVPCRVARAAFLGGSVAKNVRSSGAKRPRLAIGNGIDVRVAGDVRASNRAVG